jgi:hypothetical protein
VYKDIYNQGYLDKYKKQAKTDIGKRLYFTRWELIKKYVDGGHLLDYGCGPNVFNEQAPVTFITYGYDINPHAGFINIPNFTFNTVTFWDSLEHIPQFYAVLQKLNPEWLFITCPNLESVKGSIKNWKHYRPKEHLYYFDKYSLEVILESLGYKVQEFNFDEGRIRDPKNPEAIITVVAKRDSSSTK